MFTVMAILLLVSTGDSIHIGKIDNYIMIGIKNNPLLNITENECICQMVRLNGLISAMNYFQTNTTCQLYSSNISSVLIEFNLNSSFIFINQSFISITTIRPNTYQFGYVNTPNGQSATLDTTYIDAVAVNISGLVTQVSFYAAQSCNDNQIYFGAFSVLGSSQFYLTAKTNPLSMDRTLDSDSSVKLVTISLCMASSNITGCQGNAFQIGNGQYFGSYTSQCIMGFVPISPSIYPSTYYQQSSNPFLGSASTTATYSNNYKNVVLQYITILATSPLQ